METARLAAQAVTFLLSVSFRTLPIFAVAALACLGIRRASAASRHLLWAVTLASLLCLPVLCALLPPLTAPVLPDVVRPQPVTASVARRDEGGIRVSSSPSSADTLVAPVPHRVGPWPKRTPPHLATTSGMLVRLPTPVPVPPFPTTRPARPVIAIRPTAPEWLCLVWLIGAVAVLSRTALGLLGVGRLVSQSHGIATDAVVEAMDEACRSLDLKTPLSVREGDPAAPVAVPMTFGVPRPVVLLPEGAHDWPAERLRVVMLHETAHVRRLDSITTLLGQAALALYWFHPLVWLGLRRLRAEAEAACDDLVLTHGVAAPDYAGHLLDVVRGLAGRRVPTAVVTMAYSHDVTSRLTMILADHRNRRAVGGQGVAVAAFVAACLLLPLAAIRLVSSAPSQVPGSGVEQDAAPPNVWAVVSEHHLATMMAGHSKWDAALPNGVRVRLLAAMVSGPGDEVECSWTPDGKPMVPLNTQLVRTYGPGSCRFLCGIVFPSARLQNGATVSGGQAGGTQGWAEGVPAWHNGQAVSVSIWPNSPNAWAGNWAGQARGALQLTVASGPKVPLIAASPTRGALRRLPTGELLTLSRPVVHEWPALHRQVATAEVTATLPSRFVRHQTDYGFEIIGRDGRPLRAQHAGTSDPDTSQKMTRISFDFRTSEAPPLDRVKEIRLMYRPSQTAVFRGVALHPVPLSSAAQDTAKPMPSASNAGQSIQTASWQMTMSEQYWGDWPRGWPRSKTLAKTTWVRRDAPAIASSGDPPGWMSLRDAHGSLARSPQGDYLVRRRIGADERNEMAYLVDQDIQLFVGFGQDGTPPQPWREGRTVLDGRPSLLYVGHWPLRGGAMDTYRWIDPATRRLIRGKVVISLGRAGHPVYRSVTTWSDIHYNQPSPPGVFDWSLRGGKKH